MGANPAGANAGQRGRLRHLWWNLKRVQLDADINLTEPLHPAHQIAVHQIRQGEFRFTVDDYGRIHTNVTNFPKKLRPYLTCNGGRLANVDISESQPLFFGIALASACAREQTGNTDDSLVHHMVGRTPWWQPANRDEPEQSETRRQQSEPTGRAEREGQVANHMMASTMMDNIMMDSQECLVGGFDRARLPDDLRRYLDSCERKALYQAVAERLGKTRDDAKKRVMVVLFDKPWHRNATSAALDALFPGVMADIREMKRPNYRWLANFAQRIESGFMFGRVVPRIMALRPELFIATIHDSILTTVADADFVKRVMLDEFAQIGVSPQVKVEPCAPDDAQPPGARIPYTSGGGCPAGRRT